MNKGNSVPKACIARLEIEDRVEPELSLNHPALQYSPRLSTMVTPADNRNRIEGKLAPVLLRGCLGDRTGG